MRRHELAIVEAEVALSTESNKSEKRTMYRNDTTALPIGLIATVMEWIKYGPGCSSDMKFTGDELGAIYNHLAKIHTITVGAKKRYNDAMDYD